MESTHISQSMYPQSVNLCSNNYLWSAKNRDVIQVLVYKVFTIKSLALAKLDNYVGYSQNIVVI